MTKWRTVAAVCGVTLLAVAPACEREHREQRPPTPLDLATVGNVAGEVRLDGVAPPQTVVQLGSAKDCAAQHQGPVYAGDVLVHDGKVQNALVYVKEGLGARVFAAPRDPVVIDQKGCLFVPRVTAAQVGQPLRFLNSDPLAHNVHGAPEHAASWNFSLGVQGASRTMTVGEADPVIQIKCDIHPWMAAYLGIFDHPYFAVTGADGRFTLEKVPPGDYELVAWHERFGTRTAKVSLGAKEAKSVDFTFAAK